MPIGNARSSVLPKGEDAAPAMLSAEPSKPYGLARLNGSKHPRRSILPAADASGFAVLNRGSPRHIGTVVGFAANSSSPDQ